MRAPATGSRLAALMLAWLAGVAVQLQERSLQPSSFYVGLAAAGGVALLAGFAWRRRAFAAAILASAGALLAGFGLTGGQASLRLGEALVPALEGRDLVVPASSPAYRKPVRTASASGSRSMPSRVATRPASCRRASPSAGTAAFMKMPR